MRATGPDQRILVTIPISHFCEKARWASDRAGLQYDDERSPEDRRLYPADADERAEVVALEQRFGTILGVEGRRWLYHQVFKDARYFAPWNLTGVPGWERRMFPFVVAPAKIVINRYLGISPASADEARRLVDQEFDEVGAMLADGRRYLVGERFSAADLAFAALAAPALCPPEYGVPLPQPADLTDEMAAAVNGWREHPAGQFGLRMFRQERGAPSAA